MNRTVPPVALAIIGAGRMGTLYGQIANELALTRLIALTSDHKDSTRQAAQLLGVPGYNARRYQEMLDSHPEIEAVIVSTPEWAHVDPVLVCLRAGKHVLVEKPLAVSPADAWTLATAGRESGKVFTVCHSLRFSPRFALMRQAVAEGRVGAVVHVYARRNSLQPAVDRVLGQFPLPYWLAPHDIDMMLWTVGSPALSVKAWSRAGGSTRSDFVIATIRFKNGATGVIESSWCTPGSSGRPLNELFTVRGDAGMVEVIGYEQGLALYGGASAVEYPDTCHAPLIHGQTEGPYRSLLRHFAGAVRELWTPLVTASEAASVIDVAYAIQRSLESEAEIEVTQGAAASGA